MTKSVMIGLLVVFVAAVNSSAHGHRWYGGQYSYLFPVPPTPGGPWDLQDIGFGPHPYDGTSAMSDGDIDANFGHPGEDPVAFSFDDPGDVTGPGKTACWWGNVSTTERVPWILLDLKDPSWSTPSTWFMDIFGIATVHNMRAGDGPIKLYSWAVYGSLDGTNWDLLIEEEALQTPSGEPWGGPGEIYDDIFIRPATRPLGKFLDSSGQYTVNSVYYRYLRFDMGNNILSADGSLAISEIIIITSPEPTSAMILLVGILFGLRRR